MSRSIADYLKVVESWNSYLHIETQTDELQLEEYSNEKYDQWFEHINKFISDSLNSLSGEYISKESISDKDNTLKASYASSEIRDDLGDILNEIFDNVSPTIEDSEREIILDSPTASSKEKPINFKNYEHIIFICFCKAHAQLIKEQKQTKKISVVMVKSTLNWCEEKKKFDIFAQNYKTILFIIVGSINLLRKEYPEPFCKSERCTNPHLCLNLGLDSYDEIVHKVMEKYKLFIDNIRKYFEKLSTTFISTPILPLKCTPKPHIANKSSHDDFHKVLTDTNTYFTIGGISRWSALVNVFQKCYYSQMLEKCHTMYEINTFVNVLQEIKYTSTPLIFWVELSETTIIVDADYDEDDLKLFLKKFAVVCSLIEREGKNPQCSVPQNVENKSTLPLKKHEVQNPPNVNVDNIIFQKKEKRTNQKRKIHHFTSTDTSDSSQSLKKTTVTSTPSRAITAKAVGAIKKVAKPLAKSNKQATTKPRKPVSKSATALKCKIVTKQGKLIKKFAEKQSSPPQQKKGDKPAARQMKGDMPAAAPQQKNVGNKPVTAVGKVAKQPLTKLNKQATTKPGKPASKTANSLRHKIVAKQEGTKIEKFEKKSATQQASAPQQMKGDKISNEKKGNIPVAVPQLKVGGYRPVIAPQQRKVISQGMPNNPRRNKIYLFKILLESHIADAFISNNFETIRKLEKDTNSRVRISKDEISDSWGHVCSITGTVDAVLKCIFSIIDFKKGRYPCNSRYWIKFVVPDSTAKLIVDEKEENIQQIMIKSKTYIQMFEKNDYLFPNKSSFIVKSYDVQFIKTAFSMILEYIILDPKNDACNSATNSDVSMQASNFNKASINRDSSLSSKKDKMCHLKILLKSKVLKAVIGDNGEALQKLQKDTNSKISISSKFEYFPGTCERVCSIAGTAGAVLKAVFSFIRIIQCKTPSGVAVHVEFVVPDSTARFIAGENEENMRHIKIKGKAYLGMYKKEDYPSPYESCFLVRSYVVENMETTFSVILEYIANDPENGSCRNISYPRVFSASISDKSSENKDSSVTTRNQFEKLTTRQLTLQNSKEDTCHLKILLESNIANKVIGVNGETLQKLQRNTNSKIIISREGEYFPGTSERVCSTTGTVDEVLKALFFIIDIKLAQSLHGSDNRVKFVVPDSTARLIVGDEERNIEEIKTNSKAYMRMYKKKDYPSPNESCFVVNSYDVENIKRAFSLILEYIALAPVNGSCRSISYPRALPASNTIKTKNKDSLSSMKKEIVDSKAFQIPGKYPNKDKICHLKILLGSDDVKSVIGVNGKTREKMQKDTNSIVTISMELEYFPGTNKRVCSIAGTADAVLKALVYCCNIKRTSSHHESDVEIEFVVPDSTAGLIIGEKEDNIRQIRVKSKAYIRMYEKKYPSSESCFAVWSHYLGNIKAAFSMILEYIALDPENDSCMDIIYPRVGSQISNSNKDNLFSVKEIVNSKNSRLPQNSKKNKCHLEILLESDCAAALEGVHGENIEQLRRYTNSKVKVSEKFDYFPGTCKRICWITGTKDGVLEALCFIIDTKKANSLHKSDVQVEFVVPDSTARLIIGEKEENLRQVKIKSKAFVRTYKKYYPYIECFVVWSNDVENIKAAFSMILEYVALDPENGVRGDVIYPRFNLSDSNSNKDSSYASSFSTAAGQAGYNWSSQNYENQMNENYSNCAGTSSQYNYDYPDDSGYPSNYAGSAYPVPINQEASKYPSKQEAREYPSRYVTDRYRDSSNAYHSNSAAGQEIHSWSNQNYEYHTNESYSKCAENNSHYNNFPGKRSRSRTKSTEYQRLSPHKRSRQSSLSESRNYRERSRSYSGSRSRRNGRSFSVSRDTTCQSRFRRSNPSDDEFSVSGALYLLEQVRDKCGTLGGWIKTFTTSIKYETDDKSKALRLIEDKNNIQLLRMIVDKLKSCVVSAPLEEIGNISKAAEWSAYLIDYLEKFKKLDTDINFKEIAEDSLNKTPNFIINLIKTAYFREGNSNPTEEEIGEAYVKISELQFDNVMRRKRTARS